MEESKQQIILELISDGELSPIYSSDSLYVFEQRYDVNGIIYSLYSYAGHDGIEVELYEPPIAFSTLAR